MCVAVVGLTCRGATRVFCSQVDRVWMLPLLSKGVLDVNDTQKDQTTTGEWEYA